MKKFFALGLVAAIMTSCMPNQTAPAAATPPAAPAPTVTVTPVAVAPQAPMLGTIVDVAAGNSTFATLVAAVKAADLVGVLSGTGPFTVLAPTNDAFAKLPAGTVETLLKPENKAQLVSILTYHVIAAKALSGDVIKLDGQAVKTVNGATVAITVKDGKVMVNTANVTAVDVLASNGVIHVIDTVLLPPS
jgi:uncharacterized surface protein with fasciclin (FAS1) repeats